MTAWKILIVDDDKEMLSAMVDAFPPAEFCVKTSVDGLEATLLVDKEPFDFIVTDVVMPRMNGLQLVANAKNSAANGKTPVLVMSGDTDAAVLQKARHFGVVKVFPKPFDEGVLLTTVRDTLIDSAGLNSYSPEMVAAFTEGVSEVLAFYLSEKPAVGNSDRHFSIVAL